MRRLSRLAIIIFSCLYLGSCKDQHNEGAVYEEMATVDARFIMVALRSGALFAYNPNFNENVLTTRYSDRVSMAIRPLVGKLPRSCTFAGFAGSVRGYLERGGSHKAFRLDIDSLSDLRPLHESERQQIRAISPTISREKIC